MPRAVRALVTTPALTLSATLTLALGIGALTTIFSIVNGLLLRPLPVVAPERLAVVSSEMAVDRGFRAGAGWNAAMFEALRRRSAAFDGVLAWQPARFAIGRGGESANVDGPMPATSSSARSVSVRFVDALRRTTDLQRGRWRSSATGSGKCGSAARMKPLARRLP
jgi:hypothetical protein